jgi:hypothetical protein
MKHQIQFLAAVILIASLALTGCSAKPEASSPATPPVQVTHLGGAVASRVTLTEDAAKRIDLQTDTVQTESVGGVERTLVPYASIVYDTVGNTWIYTSPNALTYERIPVSVDSIDGDDAVLVAGPAAGTTVVTVGAEELFGAETEFEEE